MSNCIFWSRDHATFSEVVTEGSLSVELQDVEPAAGARGWKNECLSGSINSMCNRLSFWWKKRNILRNWDLRVHGKDTLMRHISTKKKKIKKRRIQIHEEWWDTSFARVFEINIADVEDMECLQRKKSNLRFNQKKKKKVKNWGMLRHAASSEKLKNGLFVENGPVVGAGEHLLENYS